MLHDRNLLLKTDDADELAGLLTGKGMSLCDVKRGEGRRGDLCRIAILSAPQSYLADIRYGASVEMAMPAHSSGYTLVLPLEGETRLRTRNGMMGCAGSAAGILSPADDAWLAMDAGAQRLSLSLSRDLIDGYLEKLSDRHVHGSVDFHEAINLSGPSGQVIRNAVWSLIQAEQEGRNPLADPAHRKHFEAMVIGELLLHQPHSHDALLGAPATGAVSRDVRRALDYIHAHLDEALTLADLVAIAGVPARTLNQHFREVTGFPPIAYLHRRRLEVAREKLRASSTESIGQTALSVGFAHQGRFSAAYRRMFGETPSETLRQRS